MDHLAELNERQREAVLTTEGPLLIVAGAGAGKTKTITHRILHLIKNGVAAESILAVTFTNKAAEEMRARVRKLLSGEPSLRFPDSDKGLPFVSTFHALCVFILRAEHIALGLSRYFTIADDDDSVSKTKAAIIAAGLDPKEFEPRRLRGAISRAKGDLMTQGVYAEHAGNEYFPRIVAKVWAEYDALLEKEKSLDFDDLILKTVLLFRKHPEICARYEKKWRYIHVDEYQDTNVAQYELSRLLAGTQKNICVVGDMDQSIYGWRGADFKNILRFEEDYPDTKVVLMEENYRSTQAILMAANEVIKKNTMRKEKNLFTRNAEGERISVYEAYDEGDEARFIAIKAAALIEGGGKAEDIAILYRANFQSRALEEAFLASGIPYQVLGVKFFERKEVKDVLSYLRLALNQESLADMKRIINVPPRGIGKVTFAKICAGDESALPETMQKKIADFRSLLAKIKHAATTKKISDTVKTIVVHSGLERMLKNGTEEDKERLENIYELVTLAKKYDHLAPDEATMKLLEDAALASDQDSLLTHTKEKKRAVRLMTVHAAKGLEFSSVFITGLEENLFPHRGFGTTEMADERMEEERRLFYVALTRAGKKLFLSYASVRTIFGSKQVNMPSQFLLDIPDALLERVAETSDASTTYLDW